MGATAAIAGAQAAYGMYEKKKAAKQQKKAVSPKRYAQNLAYYRNLFRGRYMPALRGVGDVLALNQQGAQQGFDAALARRGLSGSGLALAGRGAISTARMTGLGEAKRAFEMDEEQAAREAAAGTAPPTYQPGNLGMLFSGLSGGLGAAGVEAAAMGRNPQSIGELLGIGGGAVPPGYQGPPAPYYYGKNVGRG